LPILLFVNKIDRAGAAPERVLQAIAARLTPAAVALGAVSGPGTRAADFTLFRAGDARFGARLLELLAERDDALLAAYLEGRAVPFHRLRRALTRQSRQGLVHPVIFGSAVTGAGVESLMQGITTLLPVREWNEAAPLSGRVFKVERGPAGEKVAYTRLFSGTL